MDIEEIRKRRDDLAVDIAKLLERFMLETKVSVSQIELSYFFSDDSPIPIKADVQVHLKVF